jgi:phenylalanyl-tRNA synthetase beta chain
VCAVLRGVRLTPARYASLIDLQDKLHANICRKRTLVAIGTHDLATLQPPFTYAALPPASFSFVPLSDTRTFTGAALVEHYHTDPAVKHIKPYVDIVAGSPVLPLITDAAGTVLSLPPLINSAHSRITLATRDIFIEATATDLSKAHTVVNTLAAMFAEYTEPQAYAVEQVEVVYEAPVTTFVGVGKVAVSSQATPDLAPRAAAVSPTAVLSRVGAPSAALSTERAAQLLTRMGLQARVVRSGAGLEEAVAAAQSSSMSATPLAGGGQEDPLIAVSVPPTRSDVLHECDIAEDVAIAFGYNDIPRTLPPTPTTGGQNPVNALTEHLRRELAAAGCDECLTLALCSREENYGAMLKPEDGRAVILSNPQRCVRQCGVGAGVCVPPTPVSLRAPSP